MSGIDGFVAAGPWPMPTAIRALTAVARRPRGAALLAHSPSLAQPANAVLALGRYDDPDVSADLGWDAAAVVARGRALRRAERRP
jgi:hypothetical protein